VIFWGFIYSGVVEGNAGNAVTPNIFLGTPFPQIILRQGGTVIVAFHQIGHQMSDFNAKMHQIRFGLGLRPRPPSWN